MAIYGEVIRIEPASGSASSATTIDGDWLFVAWACGTAAWRAVGRERVAFGQEWTAQGPRATDIHDELSE